MVMSRPRPVCHHLMISDAGTCLIWGQSWALEAPRPRAGFKVQRLNIKQSEVMRLPFVSLSFNLLLTSSNWIFIIIQFCLSTLHVRAQALNVLVTQIWPYMCFQCTTIITTTTTGSALTHSGNKTAATRLHFRFFFSLSNVVPITGCAFRKWKN